MNLIDQAKQFVEKFLKDNLSPAYSFHNFEHTTSVAKGVEEIIENQPLSKNDAEMLLISAWFHDVGYIHGSENHEELSVKIATEFLADFEKSDEYIDKVGALIRATKFNYEPKNKLEKIIKDADYAHLGSKTYQESSDRLRKEWADVEKKVFTDIEWDKNNFRFLTKIHSYYSDYALANWQTVKEENAKTISKEIKNYKERMKDPGEAKKVKKKELKTIGKIKAPERGIDTFFRVTLNNHTTLSGIADSKANILLSVNAIIISIALSSIIPKLDSPTNSHLIAPTFIMLIFSVVSIIFAILSTRPKVTSGTFTREDILNQDVNLLFFGNFYKMPLEEYEWAVNEMMTDRTYLYNSMIKDLYYLGLVLERKYKLLRITYNIFMTGIIVSAIVFIIAFNMPAY